MPNTAAKATRVQIGMPNPASLGWLKPRSRGRVAHHNVAKPRATAVRIHQRDAKPNDKGNSASDQIGNNADMPRLQTTAKIIQIQGWYQRLRIHSPTRIASGIANKKWIARSRRETKIGIGSGVANQIVQARINASPHSQVGHRDGGPAEPSAEPPAESLVNADELELERR
jgi:hypothetical protein